VVRGNPKKALTPDTITKTFEHFKETVLKEWLATEKKDVQSSHG
jgi:hypothetical protein